MIKNLTGKWKCGTVSLAVRIHRQRKNSWLHVFQLKPSKVLEKAAQKGSKLKNLNYLCPELALKQETSLLLSVQCSPRAHVSNWSSKGPLWLQVFIPTKQEHIWFGSANQSANQVRTHLIWISGPLLDQFDTTALEALFQCYKGLCHLICQRLQHIVLCLQDVFEENWLLLLHHPIKSSVSLISLLFSLFVFNVYLPEKKGIFPKLWPNISLLFTCSVFLLYLCVLTLVSVGTSL